MIIKVQRTDYTNAEYEKDGILLYDEVIINTKNIFSIEMASRSYENEDNFVIGKEHVSVTEWGLLINGNFVLIDLCSGDWDNADENSSERIMEKTEKLYNKIVKAMEKE